MPSMDEEDDVRRFLVRGTGSQMGDNQSVKDLLDLIRTELTFQHQADATLSQASPVQNTWYTILDTTLNALIHWITFSVATTGETLEIRITIDGVVKSDTVAAAAGTTYYMYRIPTAAGVAITTSTTMAGYGESLVGRSVKIEVRKTTNNGTGTLSGRVVYSKR